VVFASHQRLEALPGDVAPIVFRASSYLSVVYAGAMEEVRLGRTWHERRDRGREQDSAATARGSRGKQCDRVAPRPFASAILTAILLAALLATRGAAFFRCLVRWPGASRMLPAAALLARRALRLVIVGFGLVFGHWYHLVLRAAAATLTLRAGLPFGVGRSMCTAAMPAHAFGCRSVGISRLTLMRRIHLAHFELAFLYHLSTS